MAIIFEDTEQVSKKRIPIPKKAKETFKALKSIYKPYIDANVPGSKILKSLGSDRSYNKKVRTLIPMANLLRILFQSMMPK